MDIPDSVKILSVTAFANCKKLECVKFSDSLTNIGYEAFRGCESLTRIKFPDSLDGIGNDVFEDCTALEQVVFGKYNVDPVFLQNRLFVNCPRLERILCSQETALMLVDSHGDEISEKTVFGFLRRLDRGEADENEKREWNGFICSNLSASIMAASNDVRFCGYILDNCSPRREDVLAALEGSSSIECRAMMRKYLYCG